MRINKLITEYLGEDICNTKGYVGIKMGDSYEGVEYHANNTSLIDVLLKLDNEGKINLYKIVAEAFKR